ncbi:MAG: hypothetical protein M1368_03830 [Thaumarchaeota archaeon]|nr:hypothetical protein [Nitrososphaerota archaeon]
MHQSLIIWVKTLFDLPTYNPGDPSYSITYAVALILAVLVLGLSLAAALRNPRLLRTKKENY